MRNDEKQPSGSSRSSSFTSLLLGWAQQGVDSVLATQRILLDFVERNSTSMITDLKEGVSGPEHSPVSILTELAVEATANFTEAQRILLNLALEENGIMMTGAAERLSGSATAVAITDRLRRGIETFIEMQQDFLTIANRYAQQSLQKPKAGAIPSTLIGAGREAMENFVSSQRKFIDIITHDVAKAKGKHEESKKTPVTKLAREAADSLIEAQKKLLDVAGQHVNVNLQAANRAFEMAKSIRPLPLSDMAGKGVKSLVDAEETLIQKFIIKRGNVPKPKPAVKAKVAPKPRPRRRETAAAAAQPGA